MTDQTFRCQFESTQYQYDFDAPKCVDFLNLEHEREMDDSWFLINRETDGCIIENSEKRTTRVYIPSTPSTPFISNVKPIMRCPPINNNSGETISRNLFTGQSSSNTDNMPSSSTTTMSPSVCEEIQHIPSDSHYSSTQIIDCANSTEIKQDTKPFTQAAGKGRVEVASLPMTSIIAPSNLLISFGSDIRKLGQPRKVPCKTSKLEPKNNMLVTEIDVSDIQSKSDNLGPLQDAIESIDLKDSNSENFPNSEANNNADPVTQFDDIQFSSPIRLRAQEVKTLTPEKKQITRTNLVKYKNPKELTEPKPFQLRTENRSHAHSNGTTNEAQSPYREKNLFDEVPSRFKSKPDPAPQVSFHRKLTIPKSPPLSKSRQRYNKVESNSVPYEEWMAMKQKFYEAPSRFKSKPDPPLYTSPPRGTTIPVTPNVLKHYSSGPRTLSTEERELKEMKKQFKARPLDQNILKGDGKVGIKFLRSHSPTKPTPFRFSATNALQEKRDERLRAKLQIQQELQPEMKKSNDLPKKRKRIARKSDIRETFKRRKLTVPQSPNITKPRARIVRPPVEETHKFVARPMPDFSNPHIFEPESTSVEAKPFHLATEERSGSKYHNSQEKLINPQKIPQTKFDPTPTIPEPFNLQSETLHQYAKQQFEQKLYMEDEKLKKTREFKARPLPSLKPFEIDYVTIETKPLNIVTKSELRAQSRRAFDERRRQKQIQAMQEQEKAKLIEKKRQTREVIKLRRQIDRMVKARPLPKFYGRSEVPSRFYCFNDEIDCDCEVFAKPERIQEENFITNDGLVYEDTQTDEFVNNSSSIYNNCSIENNSSHNFSSNVGNIDKENSVIQTIELHSKDKTLKAFDNSNPTLHSIKPLTPIKNTNGVTNRQQNDFSLPSKLFDSSWSNTLHNDTMKDESSDFMRNVVRNSVSLSQSDRLRLVRRMNRISMR